MHLFGVTNDPSVPIFFNVDASVGEGGVNSNRDDILLVQFLLLRSSFSSTVTPEDKKKLRNVRTSGVADPATITGIRTIQEHMKRKHPPTIVDGRVSRARGVSYGAAAWTIVILNASIKKDSPGVWPRLQDFLDCPPSLKPKIQKLL